MILTLSDLFIWQKAENRFSKDLSSHEFYYDKVGNNANISVSPKNLQLSDDESEIPDFVSHD